MRVSDVTTQFPDKVAIQALIDELKTYIDGIATGDIDLSNYVTKEELQAELDALDIKIDLSSYATKEELTNAINSIVLSYALKTEIPNKVSELENDSGYLTEHQDLSDYARTADLHSHTNKNVLDDISATDVSNWNDAKVHSSQPHAPSTAQPNFIEDIKVNGASLLINDKTVNIDLSKYAKKTEIPSIDGLATTKYVDNAISNIPTTDLTGYATEEYVNNAISNIPTTDLSNYYTKEETNMLIPSLDGYVTDTELEAKGYLTEHQDLSNYATKSDIPDVSGFITEIPEEYVTETELSAKGYLTEHQDLSAYAKKTDIPSLDEYAKLTDLPTKVSQLENDNNYLTSIPEEYVTETELNAKGYLTEHQDISGKVDKVEGKSLIADTEIERLVSVDNYDDTDIRAELSNKADTTDIPTVDVTKSYVDTELAKKADTDHTHTTVNGHTVKSDVPENAVFTDTIYDDTEVKGSIEELSSKLGEKANKTDEAELFLKSLADGVNSFYSESENDEVCLHDRKCKRTSSEPCVWFRIVTEIDPSFEGWLCIGLTENSVKCNPLTEYSETNYSSFTENGITFYVGVMSSKYLTSQNFEFYITIDGKKYVPANRVYTVSTSGIPSLSILNTWYNWQELVTMDKMKDGYAKIIKNNDTDTNDAMFIAYKNSDLLGIRIYKDDNSEHELRFSASGISYVKDGVTVWTK